mmetsp:Transcript_9845/g.24569  ORF Transcript_9845/g.24569 Transcript_9845/m.24569 type:complete len:269 (+) Transcript_9845:590-1396(+)
MPGVCPSSIPFEFVALAGCMQQADKITKECASLTRVHPSGPPSARPLAHGRARRPDEAPGSCLPPLPRHPAPHPAAGFSCNTSPVTTTRKRGRAAQPPGRALHAADVAAEQLGADPVRRHEALVPEAELRVRLKALPHQARGEAGEGAQAGHVKHRIVAAHVRRAALVEVLELALALRHLGRVLVARHLVAIEKVGQEVALLPGHLRGGGQRAQPRVNRLENLLELVAADGGRLAQLGQRRGHHLGDQPAPALGARLGLQELGVLLEV